MEYTYLTGSVNTLLTEFSKQHVFSFDLETTGLNPIDSRVLLAQVGFPNGKQFIVDIRTSKDFQRVLPYLEDSNYTVIIHNSKFEHKFMQHEFGCYIRGVFDTMLAEQIITAQNYPASLASLAVKHTGEVLDKTQQKSFIDMPAMEMFTPEQLEYAAKDVEILFPIYQRQLGLLAESKQEKIARIEFDLAGVVAAMELEGLPVNVTKWRGKLAEYKEKHKESELKFLNIIFDGDIYSEQEGMFEPVLKKFNVSSSKQVAEALIKMGIDLPETDKGNYKTDERTIENIHHPATIELLEYRKFDKILTTYGESFISHIHPFTNRIHPDFGQIGTETGRFSCKDPNVQNIPEEFRGCIGDLPNFKIVGADYANIELRIIAELSQDEALIKAFNLGDDPHKSTAAIMFDIPIEDVTKEQRFIAKTINFGLTYGMGAPKLRDMLNRGKEKKDLLTVSKVYGIVNRYKETYSGVTRYFAQSGRDAFNKGESVTMLGRKRYFNRPSGVDEDTFTKQSAAIKRQGGNAPIQGTNADITKLAMVNLEDDLQQYKYRAKIMIQVHDEIVLLAHKNHAESVKIVVEESMLRSAQEVITSVPVKVDCYISDIWFK